jgi:N-acetylneuraminate synthase
MPSPTAACTIIGEVAQAHDGSLGMAHAFIDAIADAGADAVKFQTHIAAAESTPDEPWRVKFSPQDASRYDYWRRMEFTKDQWHGLKRHCDERGLAFLSSPFSMAAADLLEEVGVAGWKVASGEVTNRPMLERMASRGLPVIVSTGMSALAETDGAAAIVQAKGAPLAVLQCTTRYPCPPEAVGLNLLEVYKERYDCAVGLSDHSATIFAGLAAATLGAQVLEVHVTLSRQMFGPDVRASLTPGELAELVRGTRFIETMRAHPIDKSAVDPELAPLRQLFMKSLVFTADLPAGTMLEPTHLTLKKPGSGLPAEALRDALGRRLARAVARDERLAWQDLETSA